jgi:hypothetical protein
MTQERGGRAQAVSYAWNGPAQANDNVVGVG